MSFGDYLVRAIRLLIPQGNVAERAVKSGVWVTLINVFDRILQLIKLVVLARLLAPSDFGLMGIALLTLATLKQFSNLGIDSALIQQNEDNVDKYLNTAWSIQVFRGIGIVVIAFVLAPYTAKFFSEPRATDIIRVIAVSPLLTGFQNPGVIYLRKDLEFHRQFVYKLSSTLVNIIFAIGIALVLQNVWALVWGNLAGSMMKFVVSYSIHEFRPEIGFDRELAREILNYGKWITLSGIFVFLYSQGDDAFIGWFLGSSALGFYQIAYQFSSAPATEVTQIFSRVLFPLYSNIQDDIQSLSNAYYTALKLIFVLVFPMTVGIVTVARPFVSLFLGTKWLPTVTVLQILAVWGLVRAASSASGPLFKAIGNPDYPTKIQAINAILLALLIYPLTNAFGLNGTALAVVGATAIGGFLGLYLSLSFVQIPGRSIARITIYPLIASGLMGFSVIYFRKFIIQIQTPLYFIFTIFIGIIVYVIIIAIIEYITEYGLLDDFKYIFSQFNIL